MLFLLLIFRSGLFGLKRFFNSSAARLFRHLCMNTTSRFLYIVSRLSQPGRFSTSSGLVSQGSLCIMRPALACSFSNLFSCVSFADPVTNEP